MISIKRSISFITEAKKQSASSSKQKPEARVRCVVTWHSQRVRLGVEHTINIQDWQPAIQRCKAKTTHGKNKTPASIINNDLQAMEDLINSIFMRFEETDIIPTKEEFSEAYDKQIHPEKYTEAKVIDPADEPLFKIYDEFVKDGTISGRWSAGTLVKTRTIRGHLWKISHTLSLNDIINGGINPLIEHFAKVPDNLKQKGLANTTIKNDIAFIKVFLRWAQQHGYCDASPFLNRRISLKTAERPVIFLTEEELMTVYNFQFSPNKNYLSQVRDVFCFCCFTSLRYSDVYNLRRSNITETEIHITTIKTHDSITIELNRFSRAILDKYADVPLPDDKALPVITNQKMNEYLKEMGEVCGIDAPITITQYKGTKRYDKTYKKYELLSTHCARRTFVCNALMLGIPVNIVMQWTGHSDYKTMRPYIAIADSARRSAMTVFDKIEGIEKNYPKETPGQNLGQNCEYE